MISAVPRLGLGKKHECVLCCLPILTWQHGWRASRRVQVCPRQEGDLVIPKRWFKRSVRDHARAQVASIAIQGTLPIEERRLYLICDLVVSYCLRLIDSHVNFLGSYEEHQTFNKFIAAISLSKKKKTIVILEGYFLSTRAVCSHSACHVHTLITQSQLKVIFKKNVIETRCFLA